MDNQKVVSNENNYLNKDNTENVRRNFFKNVIIVIISNIFSAASGIMIGFLVPKILSVSDYGYYKTFTLYCTYIGILHLGFIDGIYLKYAGTKYEDISKERFRTYTLTLFLLESFFSIICMLVSLFFLDSKSFLIFLFVAINIIVANMLSYFELITQITMQFKRRSLRKIILALLNIISISVLFVLYHYDITSISGFIYISITISISLFVLVWYLITFREIIFGHHTKIREEKDNILFFIKIGLPLLLSNLVSQFIFAVDQQFVNVLFDNETFAEYAFAYSMISVLSIATSAISVVFFPTIKTFSKEKIIEDYSSINSYFIVFISFCLIAYFPIHFIVVNFLDKYISSLAIFKIVLPGVVLSSCITSIKYDCYKALNHIKSFFIISMIILAVSILANGIAYFSFKEPKYIAIASIIVLFIWYIVVELYFNKKYNVKWIKNFIYMSLIITSFYLLLLIENIYLSCALYFIVFLVITFAFYYSIIIKYMRSMGSHIKNKRKKKQKAGRKVSKEKKILVTGVKGQLGYDCVRELTERGYKNVKGIDIDDLDLTKEDDVKRFIIEYKPNIVMHNAAWTAVDKAEENPDKVYEVNALAPKYIAEACKSIDAKMVYISTDYVFDGLGDKPFNISDEKSGLSVYGKTKSQGEDFVMSTLDKYFIVRISWVFGKNGNNFVKTMLKIANSGRNEISVVSDQIGSVTYTYDLSKLLCDMIETDKYGVYHATNEGYISWYEFAVEIFKQKGIIIKVNPVTTEEYLKQVPQQARRPLNSRMSKESLDTAGFSRLPEWKDALSRYLKEIE